MTIILTLTGCGTPVAFIVKCSDWLFSCLAPDGFMDPSEMCDTRRGGLPIVPPGVRIILTCSPTTAVCQRLSRSPIVRVVNYPVGKKFITKKALSSRTALFADDLLNLSHQDEHRIAQPPELVMLLPDLSDLPVVSQPQQAAMPFQHFLESDPEGLQQATALVRARITDPVALRAYEQWPLRHLPLAQKMLAHELHSTSFGFNTTSSQKEFQAWDNYREQLVTTQSLRQLMLCILQQWSIEMETDLISMEYMQHNPAHVTKYHILHYMIPDWTVSWVGLVLHCCLTASHFTWTVEEIKHNYKTTGLRHGFRVDGILKLIGSLRSSELELSRCSTKTVRFGIECELLPYLLLRLLHRAGAFTRTTGGAILCQTDTDGYIAFGHEIVESVLYQVLARDSEATGVHLPLESCVIKLIGELQNYNPVVLRKLGGNKTKSTSRSSPLIDDDTIIPGRARVTFKQVGSRFHALVSVSNPRLNLNSALSSNSRNNRLSARIENNLIQCLLDKSDGDAYKHSTAMNSSQCSILLTEAQSSPVTLRERMLDWISDPDKRAHTRHSLLLTTTANLVNYRLGTTHNSAFAFKMVSYQVSKLALFPDPVNLERALLQLDSLVTDPSQRTTSNQPLLLTGNLDLAIHGVERLEKFVTISSVDLVRQRLKSHILRYVLPRLKRFGESVCRLFKRGGQRGVGASRTLCAGNFEDFSERVYSTHQAATCVLPGPNTTESFVWICGELLYLLGSELDAIRLLSDLAMTFLSFESLTSVDILQLAHLGVGIAIKRRRLSVRDKLLAENIFQLLGTVEAKLNQVSVYPECISYSDLPKEAELMAELNQARAYIRMTYEEKHSCRLPFVDIPLIRRNDGLIS
ncbi:uncharacterized protein DEA37_0008289 [Paragonimus westermani]|uniref:Uncharacterized protein n=1 Tax=Paragonimus westermani TaxID=34504 RepID=A0A5J4NGT6_9TREM|nr:uncharacterized protein DEA37_0008289 [Paragonimus westermani]